MEPVFSIVILTKNSKGVVEKLVDSIHSQKFRHSFEVIFVDNNSQDGTVDYLKNTPFKQKRIIHVPENDFSHSKTRMKAAKLAKGRYVIFFTDDIIPITNQFLTELVKPVLKGHAQATYGVYQINRTTSDPVDAYIHNHWYKNRDDVIEPISHFYWQKFPPEFRRQLCNFDNCSSCIDKELLLKLKFPNVPYGEDMLFAKKLILNGHAIAISKQARFYHWHKVSFSYLLKRMCIDQYLSIGEFGIYYVRRKVGAIKAILTRVIHRSFIALFILKIPIGQKFFWAIYNAKILTADFLGKYIGTLADDSAKGFSPVNKKLLQMQKRIINDIHLKSIKRY